MPNYRRYRIPGGSYFFTINLHDRKQTLLTDNIDALRTSVRWVKRKRPFHIDAWVVLPDHMHCVMTLPKSDDDYSGRIREIKKRLSKSLPVVDKRSDVQLRRRERGIWQRRFWEHAIRDDEDYSVHVDYTHFNPVKHGLVSKASEWPYPTFHRYVECGIVPPTWGGGNELLELNAGEPEELRERL